MKLSGLDIRLTFVWHLVVDWVSAGSSKDPELLLELFAGGKHWFHIKISSTSLLYTFKRYYCQA